VIERIIFHPSVDEDQLKSITWLEHLNIYVEGTQRGFLKLRELENNGECRLILESKTEAAVKHLHYCKERKLMFMASLDGKF
jgi:hypothetical protein